MCDLRGNRTMPSTTTTTNNSAGSASGSLVRKIGPAIPLAVALLHGAMTSKPPQTPEPAKTTAATAIAVPSPLLSKGHPVDWWFVFKLNAAKFPKCGNDVDGRKCLFGGGSPASYGKTPFGQRYVLASSDSPTLVDGAMQCLGTSTDDPVGATFDEVYNGSFFYVLWNDQFKVSPAMKCASNGECSGPWGHSKGMLAWNAKGEGFVMQVTTPSWPASGNAKFPRPGDGNTLGCVNDDNVEWSQHFFALRLTEPDLVAVLHGMADASVVTGAQAANPAALEAVVNNGGPREVQDAVNALGVSTSTKTTVTTSTLSTNVQFFAKPPLVAVPPWQMVSSLLGGVSLRTANWSEQSLDLILSTTADTPIGCWQPSDPSLSAQPGAVEIATTGQWAKTPFSLEAGGITGNAVGDGNHAKLGVSTSGTSHYSIFGDMNQQGTLSGSKCSVSQNGRGGMFFVIENAQLWKSLTGLLKGESAPLVQ
jgi:Deoxyribonuclease II